MLNPGRVGTDDVPERIQGMEHAIAEEVEFYSSSNGDRWYLLREPNRLRIHHRPNRPSGGLPSIVGVFEFLSDGHGPQHEALLRLLANTK